jgi:hypothetical protein
MELYRLAKVSAVEEEGLLGLAGPCVVERPATTTG